MDTDTHKDKTQRFSSLWNCIYQCICMCRQTDTNTNADIDRDRDKDRDRDRDRNTDKRLALCGFNFINTYVYEDRYTQTHT